VPEGPLSDANLFWEPFHASCVLETKVSPQVLENTLLKIGVGKKEEKHNTKQKQEETKGTKSTGCLSYRILP
jgi:hypothetical protein